MDFAVIIGVILLAAVVTVAVTTKSYAVRYGISVFFGVSGALLGALLAFVTISGNAEGLGFSTRSLTLLALMSALAVPVAAWLPSAGRSPAKRAADYQQAAKGVLPGGVRPTGKPIDVVEKQLDTMPPS